VVYKNTVPLRRCGADPLLEEGKIRNVELAAAAMNGRALKPGIVFSLWRAIGRPSRSRGFRLGAEVRGGCIVPTTGGGVCVVSNAVFKASAELGWTIHERHGHTITTDPTAADLDATVAWPDVDLRVEASSPIVLETSVTRGADARFELVVRSSDKLVERWTIEAETTAGALTDTFITDLVRSSSDGTREQLGHDRKRLSTAPTAAPNCFTCDEVACHGRPRDVVRRSS